MFSVCLYFFHGGGGTPSYNRDHPLRLRYEAGSPAGMRYEVGPPPPPLGPRYEVGPSTVGLKECNDACGSTPLAVLREDCLVQTKLQQDHDRDWENWLSVYYVEVFTLYCVNGTIFLHLLWTSGMYIVGIPMCLVPGPIPMQTANVKNFRYNCSCNYSRSQSESHLSSVWISH